MAGTEPDPELLQRTKAEVRVVAEVVDPILEPHLVDSIDERAKPDHQFSTSQWCAEAVVSSESEGEV